MILQVVHLWVNYKKTAHKIGEKPTIEGFLDYLAILHGFKKEI